MQAIKWGMAVMALAVGAACQSAVTTAQQPAESQRSIQLPDGRQVTFHDGFSFGGFVEASKFGTKAVAVPSAVSGSVNASGFILNLTGNTTTNLATGHKVWLARQGNSFVNVLPLVTTGFAVQANYDAIRAGNTAAMTIPASVPQGTYGVAVTTAAETFNQIRFTAANFKTAFTVTDNTQWVSLVYAAGSDAEAVTLP